MKIRVTAFLGSPRKGGNTEILLESALEGVRDAGGEACVCRLSELSIQPCRNCGGCSKTGRCVIREDDMNGIYETIRESDRLILASPIYFFSVSAQVKILIDRCQAFWSEKYLLQRPIPCGPSGRKGLILLVGAYRKSGEGRQCAEVCATSFFRAVSIGEQRCVSVLGPDEAGAIRDYPDSLSDAREAGLWLGRA